MITLITGIDTWILHLCVALRTPFLTNAFLVITELGSPFTVTLVTVGTVIIFAHAKRWRDAAVLVFSVLGSNIAINIIKETVARARPEEAMRIYTEVGYSFPSGHATAAVALYGFIAYILWRDYHSHLDRRITLGIAGLLIIAIGFSRIYLGEHYLSDVLGGYAIGTLVLMISVKMLASTKKKSRTPHSSQYIDRLPDSRKRQK